MVGHASLEEQVDADFSRARRKALLRRVGSLLSSPERADHRAVSDRIPLACASSPIGLQPLIDSTPPIQKQVGILRSSPLLRSGTRG
jgi:hypothetical protein